MFLLPIVIFGLLFKTAAHLAKGATTVILLLMAAICCSNFISTMISGHIGMIVYHFDLSIALPQDSAGLQPAWTFTLPKWISNAQAMFAGLVLGILFKKASRVIDKIDKTVDVILKILLVAMPFFIAGFAMKLAHDGVILNIIRDYAQIFGVVAISIVVYLTLIYLVATGFNAKKFWSSLRNMIPAGVAGFGAMSSAAAMPLTIIGAEKNSSRPEIARAVVPATVNIHLIGDCIAIPIFAFAVLKNFGVAQPDLLAYLTFAMYFVMAKFSVAAIPGGGILVMLPVLESCLGFNAEMLSMITALYVLFDPVTSCANVLGNGGFAMLFSKLISKKSKEIA
ncbi:MAG: cation:dicarboxylase symporter family transporter [Candidatus Melainabacteria bacterium]|nr:cation:dicarboxylase symporter family transporter [Candidatus Melainabacteria bacterium]